MLRLIALAFLAPLAFPQSSDLALEWRSSGKYFEWKAEGQNRAVQIFYTCRGDAAKPAILMLHGFPTSSFDYRLLIGQLEADYRICTFDFPGYGISDKPADGYRYSLRDDAELTWYFASKVATLTDFALFSHDRGDSVSLALLEKYEAEKNPPFRITHQFLTNGNMYLPLSNLTDFQKRMLDPATSPALLKTITAPLLAAGMGNSTFTPPLKADDPEVRAMASFFGYQNGVAVMPATIQYLNERKQFENRFLEALARSPIPVTLIWGAHDMISPLRVADYVWTTALKSRKAAGAYWMVPCGNHYLQHDQPEAMAKIVKMTLGGRAQSAPFNLSGDVCAPVLVNREEAH